MIAHLHLSRRERQIMDVLFKIGRATAAEIQAEMPDPPSYSAVRAQLRTLEEKGHIRHEAEELRYVYLPVVKQERARKTAIHHLVETFFGGSPGEAAAALLGDSSVSLTEKELRRLETIIDEAKKKGGRS